MPPFCLPFLSSFREAITSAKETLVEGGERPSKGEKEDGKGPLGAKGVSHQTH